MNIEALTASQLLQKGVRMDIRTPFFLRILGVKKFSIKVRAPFIGTLLRISRLYCQTGIATDELDDISLEKAHAIVLAHGVTMSKIVAVAWLNQRFLGWLLSGIFARYIRWHAKAEELLVLVNMLLLYGGTSDFINTTRLVREMKITSPKNLGHKQGS